MSPIEVVFVIPGIALVVISCFLTRDSKTEIETLQVSEEVLETQKKEIEKLVQQVLDEKTEEAVVKADDYLSKISNEKIMAVNEFTDQIFERIDSNHKEVVFLYDMLNQKEDEIKKIVVVDRTETSEGENTDRAFCPFCNGLLRDTLGILFVTELLKGGCTYCY